MRQFFDADCSNRKRKNKKNLQRNNQIEPLEIIIKYENYKDEKRGNFQQTLTLWLHFQTQTTLRKKMTKIIADDARRF